ncbi:MAG: Hsp33 family molecular chaperone HslO [Sphingobium sp.]
MTANLDTLLGFTIPGHHARGRLVRLGPVLDEVLAAHNYPPAIEKVLAEALALTALLGSTLKDDAGQMTLQAQTENGVIDLLVCDYRGGELRGYVKFDGDRLAEIPAEPTLFALFGKGYLAITFDQAVSGERYQGIVPLEGASLADAAENYFCQSEQIPTLVRFAALQGGDDGCRVGGLLLQHLPEGEEGRERLHTRLDHPEWEHVRMLGETIRGEELTDSELPLETLVWRLFNEEDEVRLLAEAPLRKGCRCDPTHIRDVIGRFPVDERREMAGEGGIISVDCAFCARIFPIPLEKVES